ncbi:MAG: hypothetical protein JWM65_931 [Sphingomonas bacterium]|nr:hypothetical protein [Sphingomonas bacterium]
MIFILDQLAALPGKGQALDGFYRERYAPGALARGMALVQHLVAPPLWLGEGENRLLYLWRLPDAAAFWRKNNLGRRDPEVHAIWAEIDAMVSSRQRDTLADPADFDALADG